MSTRPVSVFGELSKTLTSIEEMFDYAKAQGRYSWRESDSLTEIWTYSYYQFIAVPEKSTTESRKKIVASYIDKTPEKYEMGSDYKRIPIAIRVLNKIHSTVKSIFYHRVVNAPNDQTLDIQRLNKLQKELQKALLHNSPHSKECVAIDSKQALFVPLVFRLP